MPQANRFTVRFHAPVWLWQGKGAWHFVTVPALESSQLKELDSISLSSLRGQLRRGWGSIPVQVSIGSSTWDTSIFPDKKSGCYLLPLKAAIRKTEKITLDQAIEVTLSVPLP